MAMFPLPIFSSLSLQPIHPSGGPRRHRDPGGSCGVFVEPPKVKQEQKRLDFMGFHGISWISCFFLWIIMDLKWVSNGDFM